MLSAGCGHPRTRYPSTGTPSAEFLTRSRRRARLRDVTSPAAVHLRDYPQMLRDAGLRVTRPRLAVLGAVRAPARRHRLAHRRGAHATSRTCPTRPSTTCLGALTAPGWSAASSRPARSRATSCASATTTTTSCAARAARSPTSTAPSAHAPASTASDAHGFVIDEAEVTYWGLCPDCATSTAPLPPPRPLTRQPTCRPPCPTTCPTTPPTLDRHHRQEPGQRRGRRDEPGRRRPASARSLHDGLAAPRRRATPTAAGGPSGST